MKQAFAIILLVLLLSMSVNASGYLYRRGHYYSGHPYYNDYRPYYPPAYLPDPYRYDSRYGSSYRYRDPYTFMRYPLWQEWRGLW